MSLTISRTLMNEVISHCRRDLPSEACGLLAGTGGRVLAVLPLPNAAADPERTYLVEQSAQVRAFRFMEKKSWDLVGIYHSHPTQDPIPSQSDIRQAYYPQAVHVIVGLRWGTPDTRAYRLVRETGRCIRVRLEVVQPKAVVSRRKYGEWSWAWTAKAPLNHLQSHLLGW